MEYAENNPIEGDLLKIPTEYLPKGWIIATAQIFKCSKSQVEKVAYGIRQQPEIFDHLLTLAEKGKSQAAALQAKRLKRLNALAK